MHFVIRDRWAFHLFFILFFSLVSFQGLSAAREPAFPVLLGLEDAVGFWKKIFARFSSKEVVFFDPMDPGKIYSILRVPEGEAARAVIDREQARIVADYALKEEDGRVRSQRGVKEQFLSGLKISGRYISQMQKIIREEGLPPELAYLPLVESSFNVKARSSVGAVGMWQFMADTGKKFLHISDAFDERRDPLASTRAAARLLKENYRLLGNWPLAITAYNHGTEGIFRGVNAVGSRNLVDLIRGYQSPTFGFASKNFYAEFLAAIEIATNSQAYFPFLRAHPPLKLQEIEINRRLLVNSLLKPTAISERDFFEWNPALSAEAKHLPLGYRVKLPPEKVASFVAAQRRVSDAAVSKNVTRPAKRGVSASQIQGRSRARVATAAKQTSVTSPATTRQTREPQQRAVPTPHVQNRSAH
jgi:membrane-bound lytic murein transglycosylase D